MPIGHAGPSGQRVNGHCHTCPAPIRVLLWSLVAAALFLRAVVPAGWMPAAHESGLRIALCSGSGPQFVTLERDGTLRRDAPVPVQPRDPCPFGLAMAMAADLPAPVALPLPPAALAALVGPVLAAARLVAWRAIRPPARGPPVLA